MILSIVFYLVVFFDQLTKWWAYHKLRPIKEIELIKDALYFKYDTNDGMAFGLLDDKRWIFITATVVILAAIVIFYNKTKKIKRKPVFDISLGLILGGGVGNMIDRTFFADTLFCGAVFDFIDFRLINFAIFNLADSAVCVGAALFCIYMIFFAEKDGWNV